jgi:hypothetical protein
VKIAISVLLLSVLATGVSAQELPCLVAIKHIVFDSQGQRKTPSVPRDIGRHLPGGAIVQLVLPLSASDTLTIYGADDIEPDTQFLVTRRGNPIARFAVKELLSDHDWGKSLSARDAVHLCANGNNLSYVVLQAGNQGGCFVMLTQQGTRFRLLPIRAVQQGRLVLNVNDPPQITVWNVASEDATDCTGCPKHYIVEAIKFDGNSFKVIEKRETKKKYRSFQDEPLKLSY